MFLKQLCIKENNQAFKIGVFVHTNYRRYLTTPDLTTQNGRLHLKTPNTPRKI